MVLRRHNTSVQRKLSPLVVILMDLYSRCFCIDRYKTRRWTKACQMIYLPIGMKSETAAAQRGRPRAFDPDAALERAMHVFGPKVTKALRSQI